MKVIRIIAAFLLIDFVALNVWAISTSGFGGLVDWMMSAPNNWHYVIMADVVLAISMCIGFMWYDARKRGDSPIVETVLSLFGSAGPLLYIARRKEEPT
jgi:hypothetical protein